MSYIEQQSSSQAHTDLLAEIREYRAYRRDIINGSNHKVPHLAMTSVLCFPFTLFHITSPSHQRILEDIYMNDMTSLATDVLLSVPFYIDCRLAMGQTKLIRPGYLSMQVYITVWSPIQSFCPTFTSYTVIASSSASFKTIYPSPSALLFGFINNPSGLVYIGSIVYNTQWNELHTLHIQPFTEADAQPNNIFRHDGRIVPVHYFKN